MPEMTPVSTGSQRWKSWETYKQTEEYANTRRWALHEAHVDGSLWAAFEQGFAAAILASGPSTGQAEIERAKQALWSVVGAEVGDPDYENVAVGYLAEKAAQRIHEHEKGLEPQQIGGLQRTPVPAYVQDAIADAIARGKKDRARDGERSASPARPEEVEVPPDLRAEVEAALREADENRGKPYEMVGPIEYRAMPGASVVVVRQKDSLGRRYSDFINLTVSPGLNGPELARQIAQALTPAPVDPQQGA